LEEIRSLREQLCEILKTALSGSLTRADEDSFAKMFQLMPPTPEQEELLCQVICAGLIDQVAIRIVKKEKERTKINKNRNINKKTYTKHNLEINMKHKQT